MSDPRGRRVSVTRRGAGANAGNSSCASGERCGVWRAVCSRETGRLHHDGIKGES